MPGARALPCVRGTFPGLPDHARRAADRNHGPNRWMAGARRARLHEDGFPYPGRESQNAVVCPASPNAGGRGQSAARGVRLRGGKGQHHLGREESDRSRNPLWYRPVPERSPEGSHARTRPPCWPARGVHVWRGSRMTRDRDALITGIGIVSCLGSGAEAHGQALNSFKPIVDSESFPPFVVHPLAPLDLDKQIPKRGDQRQMEMWQRMGVYAAGLALDSAGVKGNTDLLSRMGMIVAAGGGERDYAVDAAILSGYPKAVKPGGYLNEHLLGDLRPTLFLAQLSNLLAGNISIVHGVIGSSRTFMGEEASGADAV